MHIVFAHRHKKSPWNSPGGFFCLWGQTYVCALCMCPMHLISPLFYNQFADNRAIIAGNFKQVNSLCSSLEVKLSIAVGLLTLDHFPCQIGYFQLISISCWKTHIKLAFTWVREHMQLGFHMVLFHSSGFSNAALDLDIVDQVSSS